MPVVLRAPTRAAASATAGQVSRPQGSATTLSFGKRGELFADSGGLRLIGDHKNIVHRNNGLNAIDCVLEERLFIEQGQQLLRGGFPAEWPESFTFSAGQDDRESVFFEGAFLRGHDLKSFGEFSDKTSNSFGKIRGFPVFSNLVHDCAADNYRIAIGGDLSDLVGVDIPNPTAMEGLCGDEWRRCVHQDLKQHPAACR